MSHAIRTIRAAGESTDRPGEGHDGAAALVVLLAAVMVAALTLFAGANLLGDRFDRAPATAWQQPA
jgi:hypothetical protein